MIRKLLVGMYLHAKYDFDWWNSFVDIKIESPKI